MKRVVYPGSFDPITLGHMNIIERASKIFDEVIVLIMKNVDKQGFFSYIEREKLLKNATMDLKNVKVDISTGLLIDYMNRHNIDTIVKGLRTVIDFQYEENMALVNRTIDPKIDTVFLLSDPEYIMVSASNVRELLSYNADITDFVPASIKEEIYNFMKK